MAGPRLIDDYVGALAAQLPDAVVSELADGLTETFDRFRREGLDPDAAARASMTEFGRPSEIVAAFVESDPVRRAARRLLVTGPVVGLCWATALVTNHVWTRPASALLPFAPGGLLVITIALLAAASFGRRYHAVRWTGTAACLGMAVVDVTMLTVALLAAPGLVLWPVVVLAGTASAARIAFSARTLRAALTT
ncbi:hypothetical protein [Xylanimonas sp. McL0601]|uniref:hypothetical protein n=1 Tax=Xylanimonas sp. McL0601 TaxID=3414739 RepID=UPI003CECABED